ncbi:MAG: class I SAM-dependent methyltransferase [Oscillospiraceae bacterium]|nr:class I SAM-dependent methyltransferase [Oscillospiraceae bacterium]
MNHHDNSYEAFAAFYDALMAEVDYPALAARYDGLIRDCGVGGGILLDLACGTGTLSVLLAERGWDVVAADSCPEMLARAKPHERVRYICQDMRELDLFGTINAAVCSLDGLNHLLCVEELAQTIGRVALFCEVGAVFVFDVNTPLKHETTLGDNIYVKESDNLYCVWRNEYTWEGIVDITLDIFGKNGNDYTRSTIELTEKAYPLDTIRQICEQSGFEVVDIITENSDETGERAVFVCRLIQNQQSY